MRIKNSRKKAIQTGAAVVISAALVVSGCSSDDDDDSSTSTSVSSLNSIPDVSSLLVSSSTSLHGGGLQLAESADAVVGTPPAFSTLSASNLETYLIPEVSTLVSNITSAANSQDWTTFDTHMGNFRDGQAKCYVMQDAARQIADLSEASTSSCYMKKIDPETGTRAMTYVSGTEVAQGEYFKPAESTVYRAMQLYNFGLQSTPDETIIFEIQGTSVESGVYQVGLNFCSSSGDLRQKEIIRVDNNTGTLTVTTTRSGSSTYEGQSQTYARNITLTASLLQGSDGSISFDPAATRSMVIRGRDSSSSFTGSYNGTLDVSGNTLTAKFIFTGEESSNNSTFTFSEKSAAIVKYSGSSFDDVAIFEGAGKRSGTFNDGSSSFEHSDDIIFEYDETASPRYKTVTETDLSTALAAIDFTTDSTLSQSSPAAPDTTLDSSICSQTPDSVYSIDANSEAMTAVSQACEAKFDSGKSRICNSIRQVEDQIWSKLNQRNQAQ